LLDELATVRLRETSLPGVVRVDHDSGRHDDMVQALGFAVTALLERPGGGGSFEVAQGLLPTRKIDRNAYKPPGEPPVPVVHEGEARPVEQLLSFRNARHHPDYRGPDAR